MAKLSTDKKNIVLEFIKLNPDSSSKEIYDGLQTDWAYATLKRTLQKLISENLISTIGKGKGTKYQVSRAFELLQPVDVKSYFKKEIDERTIKTGFNYNLIKETLQNVLIFSAEEFACLDNLQKEYEVNVSKLSAAAYSKELERLAIDLSWKSSQIEGNTYSLLETERLLKEKETATGKTRDEASMLLNHKEAIDFIIKHPSYVKPLTVSGIEDVHGILIKELAIARNIRNQRVGISGTNYKPLDNAFQIKEALEDMCRLIEKEQHIFTKALLALVLISYIQPFADGNKRTARIISNAILMNNKYCPVSFRTVDSVEYKKAMLLFYEQNNISACKQIFISQFEFAVKTYF